MNRLLIIRCPVTLLVTCLAMTWHQEESPNIGLPQDSQPLAQRLYAFKVNVFSIDIGRIDDPQF